MAVDQVWGWALSTIVVVLMIADYVKADVVVHTNGYASYTQKLASSKLNNFQIQFRTKDHTGLLMHATGGSDFITLELVKGKLRYAADYGLRYDSYGQVTSGFHELYVGQGLADNEWHIISLIHNEDKHKVAIKINGLKEAEYEAIRTIPQHNVKFSLEYVHTGGMKFIGLASAKESVSQKGIDGCFKKATYNGKSVIDGVHVTLINAKSSACPLQPFFKLVDFPFKGSYISYNYTGNQMVTKFAFKTRQVDQVLFETEQFVLPAIQIRIDKAGKVLVHFGKDSLSPDVSNTHDGYWHNTKFSWTSLPPFKIILDVDGKAVSKNMTFGFPSLDFVQKIFFGKRFQGCMSDIEVSGKKLHSSDFDKYGPSSKWEPTYGSCVQAELCVPNPCLHGGTCKELAGVKELSRGSFQCNCSKTGYSGSVCNKALHSKSCSAIKAGPNSPASGKRFIDVDGIGPLPKIEVECHFGFQSVSTVINTKLAGEVPVENIFGQKRIHVPYTADKRSIWSITSQSQQCQQHVQYVCTRSALFLSPSGPPQVRWLGPDEYFHYYWGGSNGRTDHCHCGVYNNCTEKSKYCNCDARSDKETKDEGSLTNKKHLPMWTIEFFDVSTWKGSKGRFSIGALKCSGDVSKDNAVSFRDSMAYLSIKPTSVTDYNNAIDALTVSFNFKTTNAEGMLLYGKGRISVDYIAIKIQNQHRLRAEINLGSMADFVDVTINGKFDDDASHSVSFEFNRKDIALTVDGTTVSRKRNPLSMSHLDLDGEAMSVGGGEGVAQGFVGCVSSMFINGLMIDLKFAAKYMEEHGVHAGCGIGCNRPGLVACNYGKCIEKYSSFTCDCSISPFDGRYCHKESYPVSFTKDSSLMYTFETPVLINEGVAVVAFKTDQQNSLIFSIHGDKPNCHLSLVLMNGNLRVAYNFDTSSSSSKFLDVETASSKYRFDDGKLHAVRIFHNGKKVTAQLLDGKSSLAFKNLESGDELLTGVKISIASVKAPLSQQINLPNSFIGCMSSFKYRYLPHMAEKAIHIDVFSLFGEKSKDVGGDGKFGPCGKALPTPPPLPRLIGRPTPTKIYIRPAPQITKVTRDYSMLIILVACVVGLFLLIVLVILCRHINRNLGAYKTNEERRPVYINMEELSPTQMGSEDGSGPETGSGSEKNPKKKEEVYV